MNCRGFALVASLWLLAIVGTLAAAALTAADVAAGASRNRAALARGEWAGEACFEIAKSKYARWAARYPALDDRLIARELLSNLTLDSTALGAGIWCTARPVDAGVVLNPGCPGAAGAVDPTDRINLNGALIELLRCLPGLGDDGARALIGARRGGQVFQSLDEALAAVPRQVRERLQARFGEFARMAVTRPPAVRLIVTGWAGPRRVQRGMTVLLAIGGTRVAVLSREAE